MEHIELLFDKNIGKLFSAKFNSRFMRIDVILSNTRIDGTALYRLLKVFKGVIKKYGRSHPPIFLDFSNVEFADKLTYITLECIVFCLVEKYHFDILINISGEKTISASGWEHSPLLSLTDTRKEKRREFIKQFGFMLNSNHYRRVVRERGDKAYISKVYDDISDFIRNSVFDLDENCMDEIAGVIAELISNAIEHGEKECLVDVDIEGGFYNRSDTDNPKKEYIGLSLVVVNFSEKCIGEDLRIKMSSDLIGQLPERYLHISEALLNHQDYFDDNYYEEDFYNIAIFQNNISGRYNTSRSGGTGMLKLVKALGDRSEGDNCYLLSGTRIVHFHNQYMEYDDNGWIGFNVDNDFLGHAPADGVIQFCDMYFPGVAYNLQFIMERGKNEKDKH